MEIKWHGERCFTIKGKKTTIITDPIADRTHKLKKVNADTVLLSNDYEDKAKLIEGAEKAEKINWPGEYEIKGASILSIPAYTKEKEEGDTSKGRIIILSFMVDTMRICHLGLLGEEPDEEMLDKIGDVDILLLPIAGKRAVDPKKAHEIIEAIEPRVVIPMNYSNDSELEPMLKEMGVSEPEKIDVYDITSKAQLPEEKTDFVILNTSP